MAKVIADAGNHVVATDLASRDGGVFPVVGGVDALQVRLLADVRTIVTNPPYRRDLLPKLVEHWLRPGSFACSCEESARQALTSKHPAYHGRIKLPGRIRWLEGTDEDKGGSPQHDHCWLVWDWNRDVTKLPYEVSAGDPRLKGCVVCGAPMDGRRRDAVACSVRCRVTRNRRGWSALSEHPDAPRFGASWRQQESCVGGGARCRMFELITD